MGNRVSREEWDHRAAAVGLEWLANPPNARTPTPARCLVCGHEWSPTPSHVRDGHGCPSCAGQIVTREDYDRRAAALNIEWIGAEPVRSSAPHPARCLTCGYEWNLWADAVKAGHGCPACAPYGFDPAAPATVYLLRHHRGPVVKVGVADADKRSRLAVHKGRGWEALGTWPVPTGRDALAIEAAVIQWWEDRGAVPCEPEDVPAGDGYTEAVFVTAAVEESGTLDYIAEQVEQVGGGA